MKVNKPIRPAKKKTAARKKDAAEPLAASSAVSTALTFKLQKLLAQKGLGSRREMEVLIASGQVKLNDQAAVIGDRAGPGDIIRIGRRVIRIHEEEELPKVLLYHKPEGEIVSRSDPQDRPSVFDKLPYLRSSKWIAIGRLDFNTSGLLIFTNDGALANRMMHPRFEMEREYAVRILGELTEEQMQQLTTGITLEDGEAAFSYLADQGGEGANHWYRVILKEGKNREVRRMFEAIGLTVSRLMRVRFGPINLPPRIKRGQWLELDEKETRRLLSLIK
ncbi:ribosomal large subunit pseudouridine synthase B [Nitrosomonas ureae]|uniref:Pseudouridine synthase n=1 Tax=Nitrosomonas ureae TaxID=44577 RepID=A0A286ABH0_9PROT|nr:pseudouridine synthase [Nitrosomonas ureae]PXX15988.1 ribosomal large subunit pseudouridine synthase B [Nitrosomonas ureae]SOD19252.1 ribosomal large subunit pseudouridine synthase B [Nitrosomonas ureae]